MDGQTEWIDELTYMYLCSVVCLPSFQGLADITGKKKKKKIIITKNNEVISFN